VAQTFNMKSTMQGTVVKSSRLICNKTYLFYKYTCISLNLCTYQYFACLGQLILVKCSQPTLECSPLNVIRKDLIY